MIDLINQSTENQKKKERKPKRILIAERNSDIQYLYSLFTKQYGFSISDVKVVQNGNKCLEIDIFIIYIYHHKNFRINTK